MAKLRIPYYRVIRGRGFWKSTPDMRAVGLDSIACGPDGPEAWAKAHAQNAAWEALKGQPAAPKNLAPRGSLDEAFRRYRATEEWRSKAPRTQEEWERAWTRIAPVFGALPPTLVQMEMISRFRAGVERKVSRREAHRVIKIWRALWRVAAALGYCQRDSDPSLGVRNKEPERRQELWSHGEVVRLIKGAWRARYFGLAAIMAVAWDSSLSPVDMRRLTPAQRAKDGHGDVFSVARAKTGRRAVATLSRLARRVLDAYLASLGAKIAPNAQIFRNRSGRPYSKDTLGDDFRAVRTLVFGENERRTLADFRRSGTVEALRGGASPAGIGIKLANDFESNANLQKTYTTIDLATVRQVDEARKRGRK